MNDTEKVLNNREVKNIVAKIVQYVDIAKLEKLLDEGKTFAIDIPAEYKKDLKNGKLFFMKKKSGDGVWPILMKKANDGRNEVFAHLPVKEKVANKAQIYNELARTIQSINMQEQLEEEMRLLENTYEHIKEIERNQFDDKIGQLEGGNQQIRFALACDEFGLKKQYFVHGIQDMTVAHNKIKETLKRRVESFKPVPDSRAKILAKETSKRGYCKKKDEEVENIQDYYDAYLRSTYLLCTTFYFMGDTKNAKSVYDEAAKFTAKINFKKLRTIDNIHKNTEDMFYNRPLDYLLYDKELIKQYFGDLEITVTKKQIQEAIDEYRNEEVSKTAS